MIRITPAISIDEREIEESFVRSSGPGGQNVNKLSTAVQLRFDVRGSPSLANDVALRLMRLSGNTPAKEGGAGAAGRADPAGRRAAGAAPRHQAHQGIEGGAAGGEESTLTDQGVTPVEAGT